MDAPEPARARPAPGQWPRRLPELEGGLASVGLVPLARFLARLGKSGDLLVARDAWQARICLDQGRLTAAVAGDQTGWPALEVVLLGMASGDFEFTAGRPSLAPNLEAEDDHEAWARLEHLAKTCQAAAGAAPGPTAVPTLTRVSGADEQVVVALDRASLAVLLAVDGRSDVDAIAARHGRLRTLKALVQLRKLDLITFDGPAGRLPPAEDAYAPPAPSEDTIPRPASAASALAGRLTTGRLRPWRRTRVGLAGWLTGLTALLALLVLSTLATSGLMFVKGSSMLPSLRPGQLLLLNRAAYLGSGQAGPRRGDVVVFRRGEAGEDEYVVKRVIGVPGDLVQVDTGRVFVNGARLDEPYVLATDDYTYPQYGGPLRVPEGAYFVLGDNRPVSADSHLGWFVPAADLVGQAWPLPVALPAQAPRNG